MANSHLKRSRTMLADAAEHGRRRRCAQSSARGPPTPIGSLWAPASALPVERWAAEPPLAAGYPNGRFATNSPGHVPEVLRSMKCEAANRAPSFGAAAASHFVAGDSLSDDCSNRSSPAMSYDVGQKRKLDIGGARCRATHFPGDGFGALATGALHSHTTHSRPRMALALSATSGPR